MIHAPTGQMAYETQISLESFASTWQSPIPHSTGLSTNFETPQYLTENCSSPSPVITVEHVKEEKEEENKEKQTSSLTSSSLISKSSSSNISTRPTTTLETTSRPHRPLSDTSNNPDSPDNLSVSSVQASASHMIKLESKLPSLNKSTTNMNNTNLPNHTFNTSNNSSSLSSSRSHSKLSSSAASSASASDVSKKMFEHFMLVGASAESQGKPTLLLQYPSIPSSLNTSGKRARNPSLNCREFIPFCFPDGYNLLNLNVTQSQSALNEALYSQQTRARGSDCHIFEVKTADLRASATAADMNGNVLYGVCMYICMYVCILDLE